MKKTLIAVALAVSSLNAQAEGFGINLGGVSHHLTGQERHYNEQNWGVGGQYEFNRDWMAGAGVYRNSIRNTSRYAVVGYTPLHVANHVSIGALAGVVDGYNLRHGDPIPLVLPLVKVDFKHVGFNFTYVPPVGDVDSAVAVMFVAKF